MLDTKGKEQIEEACASGYFPVQDGESPVLYFLVEYLRVPAVLVADKLGSHKSSVSAWLRTTKHPKEGRKRIPIPSKHYPVLESLLREALAVGKDVLKLHQNKFDKDCSQFKDVPITPRSMPGLHRRKAQLALFAARLEEIESWLKNR
jgi:hypothetical protein